MTAGSTAASDRRPPPRPAAPVAVRGLVKRYGPVTAVADLDLDVAWGRVTGFLGANGAGKSTTLRCLLGLATPTAGTATVLGRAYADLDEPVRRVGALLETQSFHPARSGREHLRTLALAAGLGDDRVDVVLDAVELSGAADRRAGGYSLGMRQRLGLAAALLGDPDVLVLDEPGNGLDPQGLRWLRGLLRGFAARGGAVLVSSHLLDEVELLADDVAVIAGGRLVRQAPIGELTGRGGVSVRSRDADRLADALAADGLEVARDGDRLLVGGGDAERIGAVALAAGVALSELAPARTRLEDVFLDLIGDRP